MNIPDTKITVKQYMRIYDEEGRSSKSDEIEIQNDDIDSLLNKIPQRSIGFDTYEVTEFIHDGEVLHSKPRNTKRYVRKGKIISIDEAISKYGQKDYFDKLKEKGYENIVAIREIINFLPYKSDVIVLEEGFKTEYKNCLRFR